MHIVIEILVIVDGRIFAVVYLDVLGNCNVELSLDGFGFVVALSPVDAAHEILGLSDFVGYLVLHLGTQHIRTWIVAVIFDYYFVRELVALSVLSYHV